ncbi:hypothetical protein E4T50_10616 [Aureobasidium sp. EXF-12298]|nr:hypothetical protein E4T50_10616 [Aureobasidium sp. EXF-12298]KAI4756463.1 hypothetical protein E4T51_10474 [Aureobasidium sp. EXF-12344]KAI4773882.1 hypothetical protein E4T52_11123 [Aureobasidium sp. EXF-3400]
MNNRVPHHTTEQQAHQEHDAEGSTLQTNIHKIIEYYNIKTEGSPKPKPRHLPPPSLSVEKEVIIICKTLDGKVNREYRFKREIICRHSARIFDLCLRRTGSTSAIIYVYVEHQHNIFAHYERWVRKSELPTLDVTIADQRDRMIAATNAQIIEVAKKGSWSFYKRSVVDYIKKAPDGDELRQLLLDLHVACFEINLFKRYFWMLGPKLCFAVVRRKMLAHPPTMEGMGKVCAYHQHDQLYPWGECGAKVA